MISLILGGIFIASFFLWLEIVNLKQKENNKIHKDKNKVIKNKRS
jgi:hypothetical protein